MVLTLIEHALYAAMFQVMIGLITGNWWVGGALASSYFFGREVAQAEYRWIELFGEGLRANMPWHAVLEPKIWHTADQIADWLGPIAATLVIALLASSLKRRTAKPPHANSAHETAPPSRP